jgi:hypothetical protein
MNIHAAKEQDDCSGCRLFSELLEMERLSRFVLRLLAEIKSRRAVQVAKHLRYQRVATKHPRTRSPDLKSTSECRLRKWKHYSPKAESKEAIKPEAPRIQASIGHADSSKERPASAPLSRRTFSQIWHFTFLHLDSDHILTLYRSGPTGNTLLPMLPKTSPNSVL